MAEGRLKELREGSDKAIEKISEELASDIIKSHQRKAGLKIVENLYLDLNR